MTVLLSGTTPLNETCISYKKAIIDLFRAKVSKKRVLVRISSVHCTYGRVRRQATCYNDYGLFKQLKHGKFIWEYIRETNCTYFKICRCWKRTKWFDDWSRYKRVRSVLKRKNEYPRIISSYHFPVIFKTTQPVSGYRVTEIGRLHTGGPNMGGNFMCWRQYNHVYLTKGFSYCKYIYWKLNY